jgi:tetratricopeptide (TPR) repeat protein
MQFKRFFISIVAVGSLVLFAAEFTSAQLRLPRPSQGASVTQTIGVTDITINYSRPPVKGRTIFADAPASMAARAKGEATLDNQNERQKGEPIVPYGHVWRTGANEATQFVITDDVTINGQKLAAGSYSLHTIPGKDEWTIVFNGTANQWGSFSYDPAKDTLRVKAKPEWVNDNQEWLAFSFDPVTDNSATVNIRWEKVRVPFNVTVDVVATTLAKARTSVANAKPDDWRTLANAAGYANQNGDKEDAAKWFNQALAILDGSIASKATFQNLSAKANLLINGGRKDEGLAVADRAIAQGKADKADTAAFEKRIADIKASKN